MLSGYKKPFVLQFHTMKSKMYIQKEHYITSHLSRSPLVHASKPFRARSGAVPPVLRSPSEQAPATVYSGWV